MSSSDKTALRIFQNDKLPPRVLAIHIIIVACIVLAIFTNSFSFAPVFAFQCKNYILNTYLYFLLTWGIALLLVSAFDQLYTVKGAPLKSSPLNSPIATIITIIASIGLLFLLFRVRGNIYAVHFVYLLWTATISILLYRLFVRNRDLFYKSMVSVVAILVIFTIISFIFPDLISNKVATYLFGILIAIIVARIVEIILYAFDVISPEDGRKMSKGISYVAIVLFTMFLIYDTDMIRKKARTCNVRSFFNAPNYVESSLGIFLDSLNLMSSIFDVMSD
jgi:FtsH-binding integral membrane protein